ncbi:MAG: hypothetical protein FJ319_03515 [SAR202 cluster bacterium]|nr:hypothetical protein [SAR202 cluster bacterium]
MEQDGTKGERRENKRRNQRKMKVVGKSVQSLQEIIRKRAEYARKEDQKGENDRKQEGTG